jgi:DNA-binding transcriptional regulator/RsmH inhibitor MraZ
MAESDTPQPIFCDEFEHKLDSGWRVVLPKDWRSLNITEFFVTESSASSGEAALRVFTRAEWENKVDELKNLPDRQHDKKALNDLVEEFSSRSKRVVPDKDGRITIPDTLWQGIGISPANPEVTLCGAHRSFRIWNRAHLKARRSAQAALDKLDGRKPTPHEILGI